MGATYQIGSAIGFNLIFIVLGIIAILTAKVKALPWVLYGVGLGLTVFSLIGAGGGGARIVICLIVAVLVPVLIKKRKG